MRILDFKTTWSEFQMPSQTAAVVAVASAKVYLTTLLSKVFSFSNFLGGRDGDGRTVIWTDRLFSENIVLDEKYQEYPEY